MKLKEIRERKNISQRKLSQDLNIKPTTYNGYEKEISEPNIKTLIQLADYFHTTVDYLIGHDVPYIIDKGLFNNEQLEVIEKLKTLDKEQCKLLATYIDGLKDGIKKDKR